MTKKIQELEKYATEFPNLSSKYEKIKTEVFYLNLIFIFFF